MGGRKAVQGNVDPAVLFGTADAIRRKVAESVRAAAGARGFIANLGHGVLPFHTPEQVGAYLDAVHEYSAAR